VLLDVRRPDEYQASHIEGSTHIELQTLETHLPTLCKQSHYLIYCRSGVRSKNALNLMKGKGFGKVTNFLGGILAWSAANLPTKIPK
jgi:rhodanese-related sulfurtransferase